MVPGDRLLPLPALQDKVGFKHTKIYELIRAGDFPPGKLIHGKRLWRESEIDAWIDRAWNGTEQGMPEADSTPVPVPVPAQALPETSQGPSAYWTSIDLKQRYGVNVDTLKRWEESRGFPAPIIPGGHGALKRWFVEDVRAWEARQRRLE